MIVLKIAIKSSIQNVWNVWNTSNDITNWYSGHKDWNTTESINELKVGKSFCYSMMSKDKKSSFVFKGQYTRIDNYKMIRYLMEDKRKVETTFQEVENGVIIIQKIEVEDNNPPEIQALWWKTILSNFKKYAEN